MLTMSEASKIYNFQNKIKHFEIIKTSSTKYENYTFKIIRLKTKLR